MKLNPKQSSTQPRIFESPHQQAILTPPNPPTEEMKQRAKFVDKTYVWNQK